MLLFVTCVLNMLKMQGLIQNIAFVLLIDMVMRTQFQIFHPGSTFSQSGSQMSFSCFSAYLKHPNRYVSEGSQKPML